MIRAVRDRNVSCLIPLIATLEATGGVADFITRTQVALVAIDMGNRPRPIAGLSGTQPACRCHQLLVISAVSLALVALVRWRRAGKVPPILRWFALALLAFDLLNFLARAVYRAASGRFTMALCRHADDLDLPGALHLHCCQKRSAGAADGRACADRPFVRDALRHRLRDSHPVDRTCGRRPLCLPLFDRDLWPIVSSRNGPPACWI